MMSAQILASRGRSLGGKCSSPLSKLATTRFGFSLRRSSTKPGLELGTNGGEPSPKRHSQSFVSSSPDMELGLGELETELPPGFHQEFHRRDRGPLKPRHANDGRDSYWRPPWKNPRAEIASAQDFANRPRVSFSESFASMYDAMAVLSWMGQEDKDGMYDLYCKTMMSIAAAQEKMGKGAKSAKDQEWGVLSAHTSHEYVVRVVAQAYNVTTSRAAGVIQLQHNEEQLKKDPDFKVNHALQEHVDAKIRETIREVYRSYREKDPLQFMEDPLASTGVAGREGHGSPYLGKASELTDVDALVKKVRMREIEEARVRIANHIYVEDVDEKTRKVKYDKEVARLLKMKKAMGYGFYDNVVEGGAMESSDEEEQFLAVLAYDDEEGEGETKLLAGSSPKRWKARRANSVFVHNLPYGTVSEDLEEHMKAAGDVVHAEVLVTKRGRFLGWGIVTFATPEIAKEVIEKLHDTDFKGRKMHVVAPKGFDDYFEKEEAVAQVKAWGGKAENSVFITGLPHNAVAQDLKDCLGVSGNIVAAKVLAKHGRPLHSGFVEFETPDEARRAIETLNKTDWKGRTICVREFKDGGERKKLGPVKKQPGRESCGQEFKTWGQKLWDNRKNNLPPKKAKESMEPGRTSSPKPLKVPAGASPYPENNRGHKEDPGTRRPRWKYTAQIVNTHMQENPKGSKRRGRGVAKRAKMLRHGRVVDGNTIIEEDGELRLATVAELERTSWKHVRNESEFMFREVKEAWLKRQLKGEVGGWGRQEEVNRTEPVMVEGKADEDKEEGGEDGSVGEKDCDATDIK